MECCLPLGHMPTISVVYAKHPTVLLQTAQVTTVFYVIVGIRMLPHRSLREAPNENLGPDGPPYLATSSVTVNHGNKGTRQEGGYTYFSLCILHLNRRPHLGGGRGNTCTCWGCRSSREEEPAIVWKTYNRTRPTRRVPCMCFMPQPLSTPACFNQNETHAVRPASRLRRYVGERGQTKIKAKYVHRCRNNKCTRGVLHN